MKIPRDPPNYKKILEDPKNQIELGKYLDRDDVKDFVNLPTAASCEVFR